MTDKEGNSVSELAVYSFGQNVLKELLTVAPTDLLAVIDDLLAQVEDIYRILKKFPVEKNEVTVKELSNAMKRLTFKDSVRRLNINKTNNQSLKIEEEKKNVDAEAKEMNNKLKDGWNNLRLSFSMMYNTLQSTLGPQMVALSKALVTDIVYLKTEWIGKTTEGWPLFWPGENK